jgi:hypothetical protein
MTAAHITDPELGNLNEVADGLAIAYLRLARAAAVNQHLAILDTEYQGQASWDVALAVHEAVADIEDAARMHDLAATHEFWEHPQQAATVASANAYATLPRTVAATAGQLMDHLGAALEVVVNISLHTDDDKMSDALRAVCGALEAFANSSAFDVDLPKAG